jgi:hypothetical protein
MAGRHSKKYAEERDPRIAVKVPSFCRFFGAVSTLIPRVVRNNCVLCGIRVVLCRTSSTFYVPCELGESPPWAPVGGLVGSNASARRHFTRFLPIWEI